MKDDRLRIPVEQVYIAALGLAAYAFARLEWDAVWCCERISQNSINDLAECTAGIIANKLIKLANTLSSSPAKTELCAAAEQFKALVKTRNAILHGKPGTANDGGQQLFNDGQPWTVNAIDEAADEFTACSLRLNALLHGPLAATPHQ